MRVRRCPFVVATALASGCAPSPGAEPAAAARAPGPAQHLPRVGKAVCLANLEQVEGGECRAGEPAIACDPVPVCRALSRSGAVEVSTPPVSAALTADAVLGAIRRGTEASPVRIAFYTGHGTFEPGAPGGVVFHSRGGEEERPLSAGALLRALGEPDPGGLRPASGFSVLFLNTCDSGYVDLRGTRRPTTVIGSGYGSITALARGEPRTDFAGALAEALEGRADLPPQGNCDGVVTDDEAHDYLNATLADAASKDEKEWRERPLAVLKRNVDYPLPVAFPGRPPGCAGVDTPAERTRALLEELRRVGGADGAAVDVLEAAAAAYAGPLRGEIAPPTGPRRFLVFAGTTPLADPLLAPLRELCPRLIGGPLIVATGANEAILGRGARALTHLDLVLLRLAASTGRDLYLELVRLRDGFVTWAGHAKAPADADAARAIALAIGPRLPMPVELVRVDDGAGVGTVVLRSLGPGLVLSRITRRTWAEAFSTASVAPTSLEFAGLPTVRCPGGLGQCFLVDPESERPERWWFGP